jgi:hypothetical protein
LDGNQKWVSITIQETLVIRWQSKIGFGCHSRNLDHQMMIKKFQLQEIEFGKGGI